MRDGESIDFVIDVPVATDKSDRFWLLNSTAIYTRVPARFQ